MSIEHLLSIGEVVRRTGLTERTLRFYEDQGLIKPRRTEAGRRVYGAADLVRLHRITVLRRASFSLAQIKRFLNAPGIDQGEIITAQIETLEAEHTAIEQALAGLRAVRDRTAEGGTIDAETLCTLIQYGDQKMTTAAWQRIYDRYYTKEEQEHWKAAKEKLAADFNQDAYTQQWRDLSRRIEAALPLDPASAEAQAFLAEWNALLEPFKAMADAQMQAGAANLWAHLDEWEGEVDSPISKRVWEFMAAAGRVKVSG